MKTKVILMMMLALCVTWCLSQVGSAAPLITSVDRTNGVSGDRDHIGAYDGDTDPIQDQPDPLPDSWLLRDGHYVFSDRDYPFSQTPPEMIDVEYVTTFNSDKGDNGDVNYAVTVSGAARFWVTMDDRFSGQQARVDDIVQDFAAAGTFVDSGYNLYVHENDTTDRPLSVFISSVVVGAGTYNFGYPDDSNSNNFYVIGAFEAGGNIPPIVDAGPDQRVVFSAPSIKVSLQGTVTDDGNPLPENPPIPNDPNKLTQWWTITGQPVGSNPTFENGNNTIVDPNIIIDKEGVYELRLDASDGGEKDTNDTVLISVYPEGYTGLVAYYNFNEGAGDVLYDTSGGVLEPNEVTNGFDGPYKHDLDIITSQTSVDPNWKTGPDGTPYVGGNTFGTALFFDPSYNQYAVNEILNPDEDYLNGFTEVTVMMWIKSSEIDTDRGFIIFEEPAGNDDRDMRYDSVGATAGGEDVIKIGITGPDRQQIESSEYAQIQEWQHVALSWKSGEFMKFYINGVEDTPMAIEGQQNGALSGYEKIMVGRGGKDDTTDGGGVDRDFGWHGLIDEVKIYDKALTQTEIQAAANIVDGAPEITVMAANQRLAQNPDGDQIPLDVTVEDILGDYTATWSQLSGPGTASFLPNPNTEDVTVDFSGQPFGLYQLQLYVEDNDNAAWNDTATMYIMYQEKTSYDLVALYKLDESAGTTAADSSGNGLNGELAGDPNVPVWQPAGGKIDGDLLFVNSGEDINQGVNLDNVPGSDSLTVMFWMKAGALRNAVPIDKLPNDASGTGWNIKARSNGAVWLQIGSEGNHTFVESGAGVYAAGAWVHVAATFDSASSTGKIFIDGLKAGEETGITQTANNIVPPLRMAQPSEAQLGERYQGELDQVRYYDYEMTELDVARQAVEDMLAIDGCQLSIPGVQIPGDISGPADVPDCYVDMFDIAALADDWLECRDLNNPSCW